MEDTAALSGEIIEAPPLGRSAADGAPVPAAALTGGQFLDALEEGQFSNDLHVALKDLAAEMQDIGNATGQKTKGKVQITIDLSREDNAFRIAADMKVTKPKIPRPRSIMWTDEHNRFTRFPPNQGQFFGVRSVGGSGQGPRSV